MKRPRAANTFVLLILVLSTWLTGCGLQSIPAADNKVEATSAEVNNQYKRRADLIPNLVKVVKGYASHEQETLTAVTEARSKVSQITLQADQLDAQQLQKFQAAQGQLSQALGRLMVVAERYPDLKADRSFRDLQAQLEGSENRITVARQRYIESIEQFNNLITVPPTSFTNSLLYHHDKKPQWQVSAAEQETIQQPPAVDL